jgi:hypothetical protein
MFLDVVQSVLSLSIRSLLALATSAKNKVAAAE